MAANQTHWTVNEAKNLNTGVVTVATASSTADGGVVLFSGVISPGQTCRDANHNRSPWKPSAPVLVAGSWVEAGAPVTHTTLQAALVKHVFSGTLIQN